MPTVVIQYTNGSKDSHEFSSFLEAGRFCRNNISYTGGRVKRVEIHSYESVFAMWDATWDAVSQAAGLKETV